MVILQKNKGINSFLEIRDNIEIKKYEAGMLENNRFESMPELRINKIDSKTIMQYKIDGMKMLNKSYAKAAPTLGEIKKLIFDIVKCVDEIKKYILNVDNLVFEMKYILFDSIKNKYKFIYIPGYNIPFSKQIKSLFEEIMPIFDHQNKEGVIFLYDIYSKMLSDNFSPEMFEKMCNDEVYVYRECEQEGLNELVVWKKNPEIDSLNHKNDIRENNKDDNKDDNKDNYIENNKNEILLMIAFFSALILGETLIYLFLGERSFKLMAVVFMVGVVFVILHFLQKREAQDIDMSMIDAANNAYTSGKNNEMMNNNINDNINDNINTRRERGLCRYSDREEKGVEKIVSKDDPKMEFFILSEGENKIGRSMKEVDFCIEKRGISRVHAIIVKKSEEIWLRDNCSTNGTYLNNVKLQGNQEKKINYGDTISFAGEEYYCI